MSLRSHIPLPQIRSNLEEYNMAQIREDIDGHIRIKRCIEGVVSHLIENDIKDVVVVELNLEMSEPTKHYFQNKLKENQELVLEKQQEIEYQKIKYQNPLRPLTKKEKANIEFKELPKLKSKYTSALVLQSMYSGFYMDMASHRDGIYHSYVYLIQVLNGKITLLARIEKNMRWKNIQIAENYMIKVDENDPSIDYNPYDSGFPLVDYFFILLKMGGRSDVLGKTSFLPGLKVVISLNGMLKLQVYNKISGTPVLGSKEAGDEVMRNRLKKLQEKINFLLSFQLVSAEPLDLVEQQNLRKMEKDANYYLEKPKS
jgi:hypothetical protein